MEGRAPPPRREPWVSHTRSGEREAWRRGRPAGRAGRATGEPDAQRLRGPTGPPPPPSRCGDGPPGGAFRTAESRGGGRAHRATRARGGAPQPWPLEPPHLPKVHGWFADFP